MAAEDFARGKKKRRSVSLPSCFRPSPTSDAVDAKAGTSRRWRQLGGMQKKTVPVNAVVDDAPPPPVPSAMDAAQAPVPEKSKPPAKRSFLLQWFLKKPGKRTKGPMALIPTNHLQLQPQLQSQPQSHHPTSRAHTAPKTRRSQLHQVTSKSRTQPEHAPLYRIHDRAQIATQTIYVGSHELNNHNAFDSLAGLSVIATVLTMLLFCGRMGAVVFACTWMYLLPHIKATSKIDGSRTGKEEDAEVDMDSADYKKMVVLKGLLQRDGRRPSSIRLAGAH